MHQIETKEVHYVTFYSPGTLFSETTAKPIHAWDAELAVAMSRTIVERYGARPYGFRFTTNVEAAPVQSDRGPLAVEPKQIAKSGMHFIGGTVLTTADVVARADPADEILLFNMRCNGYGRVIEIVNGYRTTQVMEDKDVVVDENGRIVSSVQRTT